MNIEKTKFIKMMTDQSEAMKKLNRTSVQPGMPDFITGFTISVGTLLKELWTPYDWTIPEGGAAKRDIVIAHLAECYLNGLAALLSVPAETKKVDGTADHPLDRAIDNFIATFTEVSKDIATKDENGELPTLKDVVELIGTACELPADKHLSFLSEFALINAVVAMAYPDVTFDEIIHAHSIILTMLR